MNKYLYFQRNVSCAPCVKKQWLSYEQFQNYLNSELCIRSPVYLYVGGPESMLTIIGNKRENIGCEWKMSVLVWKGGFMVEALRHNNFGPNVVFELLVSYLPLVVGGGRWCYIRRGHGRPQRQSSRAQLIARLPKCSPLTTPPGPRREVPEYHRVGVPRPTPKLPADMLFISIPQGVPFESQNRIRCLVRPPLRFLSDVFVI